jgi:hypothetical protein
MVSFTNDERLLIDQIKTVVCQFFPHDFDLAKKENLLTMVKYWKAKGYCQPRRADNGVQANLYISIRGKLGDPVPTQEEVLKADQQMQMDQMIKQVNAQFNKKIAAIQRTLDDTKKEKKVALNKYAIDIKKALADLEAKKEALQEQFKMQETAQERLIEAREARDVRELTEKSEEQIIDGQRMRKCWNCGTWLKVAGGIFTKHIKECTVEPEITKEVEEEV